MLALSLEGFGSSGRDAGMAPVRRFVRSSVPVSKLVLPWVKAEPITVSAINTFKKENLFSKDLLFWQLSFILEVGRTVREPTHVDTHFSEKGSGKTFQSSHFPSAGGETAGSIQPVEELTLEQGLCSPQTSPVEKSS